MNMPQLRFKFSFLRKKEDIKPDKWVSATRLRFLDAVVYYKGCKKGLSTKGICFLMFCMRLAFPSK